MSVEVGMILNGKVTGIKHFGAFVKLPGGENGLVHISEVSNAYVADLQTHLQEGQEVQVKVIGVDENGRINLSIKQAMLREERPVRADRPTRQPREAGEGVYAKRVSGRETTPKGPVGFEDQLKQFMQESSGRMAGIEMYASKKTRRRSR